jgi:hypothetical protein
MCESVFKTAGEQQGNGMGTAWERHGMCESAQSEHQNVWKVPQHLKSKKEW